MRENVLKVIGIYLSILLISGCAGTTTMAVRREKAFQFSQKDKIHNGMKEEEVIKLLGKPTAVGVDEHGREYLLYQQTGSKTSTSMVPLPGYAHMSATTVPIGFELRVYLKEEIVESVGYTKYRNK